MDTIQPEDAVADTPKPQQDATTGRFLPGNCGNGGRKIGSRNKLGQQFLDDVYSEWQLSGREALKRMAAKEPGKFCALVSNILPKEMDLLITAELSQDSKDFLTQWRMARRYIGAEDALLLEADDRPV